MLNALGTKKKGHQRNFTPAFCHRASPLNWVASWMVCVAAVFQICLGAALVLPVCAQPLDRVIEDLLDDDGLSNLCEDLTGAGAVLTGELAAYCGQGGSGTPDSTGGAAGTPQTAPDIVQKRLDAARAEQDDPSQSGGAVSELVPGWSVFLSAEGETLDRDETTFEDGYNSDIWRATVGTDYQVGDKGVVGLALTYATHDGDFKGGGDFTRDAYGVIVFASLVPHDKMFVQATLGYAWNQYERTRTVSASTTSPGGNIALGGSVKGDFDGNAFSTGLLVGYDHTVGRLTIGPRLGFDGIFTEFDSYTEEGDTGLELVFEESSETSVQSRLGFAGSLALSTGFGVLVPQVSADWVHEFADAQRNLAFSFAQDNARIKFVYEDEAPDRDFFELAAGLSAVLPNGWLPYVQFRTIVGHDFLDSYVGSLGLRKEF